MNWTLTWRDATSLPVECPGLRPDLLASLDDHALSHLPARVGRATWDLGALFAIERGGDVDLAIEGDLSHLRGLGAGMASGILRVRGDVGPLLGMGMTGGRIEVHGSVSDWAAAEMRGGSLHIRGRAGDFLGAALPGGRLGMRGGAVLVEGSAGNMVGLAQRRGLIAIAGPAGDDLGHGMVAGTIAVFGAVGRRSGSGMKRGTLWLAGPEAVALPPGFRPACLQRPNFLTIYERWLVGQGFAVPREAVAGPWLRYNGDVLAGGQGEVFVRQPASVF